MRILYISKSRLLFSFFTLSQSRFRIYLAVKPISVCPDISTISQYLSSIFVQRISLKISFHSIKTLSRVPAPQLTIHFTSKSTLYRFLRTPRTNGNHSPFGTRETSLSFSIDSDVDYLQWLTASPNFIGYHLKFSNCTSEYPCTHS